jgi:hypothetical protein
MDIAGLLQTINWKTALFGIGYAVCKIVDGIWPAVAPVCQVLEVMVVTGGFVSSADASRVQNVVRAVDHLLFKNHVDPETLAPIELIEAKTSGVK